MKNYTANEWAEKAKEYEVSAEKSLSRAKESFERCDTDGFLSQWASERNSYLDQAKKELCLKQGVHSFVGLYQGTRRVKAKKILGTYGYTWLLHKEEQPNFEGRTFLPFSAGSGKSKILNSFGLKELPVTSSAWVAYPKQGGYYSFPVYFRIDNEWGENDTLIKEVA
jgi:hypothetical protein